jgi:hypothetical protein
VQFLMGGKFADGALAGFASGLADALSASLLEGIKNSVMSGAEAAAARTLARVIGSAVRAAASPGDQGQAFASAFLDDVFKQVGFTPTAPAAASTSPSASSDTATVGTTAAPVIPAEPMSDEAAVGVIGDADPFPLGWDASAEVLNQAGNPTI